MELLQRILQTAIDGGASDIHLKIGAPVVFRINRQLVAIEAPAPAPEWMNKVVDTIVPRHLKKRLEEDHEIDFSYFLPGVAELGLLDILKRIAESPRGIVLLSGPTGCGKSTTLAALVEHINANFKKHIIALEDPIEFVFEDNQSVIEQREIGLDTLSFEYGLKHILRQDPDIIMIGEMRDAISFSAAMSAADTGHLVLSTLHTTNSAQAVGRTLDFFKPDERDQVRRQMAATLQAVVCQRMVNTLNGGIMPALEIMINTATVRKLIEENRLEKLPAAIETGIEDGMQNFNQALYNLVKERKITEKEALAKATNPQALEMNFKGIFLDEARRILT